MTGHRSGGTGITELLRADYQWFACLQETLQAADRRAGDPVSRGALARVWRQFCARLELHAEAVEEVCCLPMSAISPSAPEQMENAVADLNDIREAILETCLQTAGAADWWRVVDSVLSAWRKLRERAECGFLADFRSRADRALSETLARQWVAFVTARTRDLAWQPPPASPARHVRGSPATASHIDVLDATHGAILCTCCACHEAFSQGS